MIEQVEDVHKRDVGQVSSPSFFYVQCSYQYVFPVYAVLLCSCGRTLLPVSAR